MKDKFFNTMLGRFEVHEKTIADNVKFLEYLAYDHRDYLPYSFAGEIEQMRSCLSRMREILEKVDRQGK
jgi:hypothetical protein